jgi:hypothetical protein
MGSPADPIDDAGALSGPETLRFVSPGIVDQLVQNWRRYQQWTRARVKLELQAQAICRQWTEGDKKKARTLWLAVWKAAGKSKKKIAIDKPVSDALMPLILAIKALDEFIGPLSKTLEQLAVQLPHWKFFEGIKGIGPATVAGLIGEAGDPWAYRNPSALWKRMGLAVIDGDRQRRVKDKELAERHGFNPRRAAWAFMTGENLIRQGSPETKAVYSERKAQREAAGWGKSKMHRHKDAKRFLVKRVLRDLWVCGNPEKAAERNVVEAPVQGSRPPLD